MPASRPGDRGIQFCGPEGGVGTMPGHRASCASQRARDRWLGHRRVCAHVAFGTPTAHLGWPGRRLRARCVLGGVQFASSHAGSDIRSECRDDSIERCAHASTDREDRRQRLVRVGERNAHRRVEPGNQAPSDGRSEVRHAALGWRVTRMKRRHAKPKDRPAYAKGVSRIGRSST